MKSKILFAGWGAMLLSLGLGAAQDKLEKNPGWLTDYESARRLARQANKPLMVVFRCEP